MKYRRLGKTDYQVSEISLGTWQVGGKWGSPYDDKLAQRILHEAVDHGVNFIDTADVYGEKLGQSEHSVGKFLKSRPEEIHVATKCGRRLNPHIDEAYTPQVLRKFVEESLHNMGLETIDLIQLHCPPTEVYYRPEIFGEFDKLKEEGKIRNLGVSVEKVEEALKAIEFENVTTVQIIFNMLRLRPSELFFEQARIKDVGIIVRVPLASGLLTGKFEKNTSFEEGDHRHFNRNGEAFDKGETFSGVPFEKGVELADKLENHFRNSSLAQIALQWILMHPEVSCVIPGSSSEKHVKSNCEASGLGELTKADMDFVYDLYQREVRPLVHHLW